jgi:alpha-L-fucosidase 2
MIHVIELDIGDAVSRVHYQSNGVHFSREYFVSHLSDVLVAHLSADKTKSYSGSVEAKDGHDVKPSLQNNTITIQGSLSNGLKYEWQVINE